MNKINKILIGTNNDGKYEEICQLLPINVKKYSAKQFRIESPAEVGKNFKENSYIKASYFSQKTNMICLSDDSGLEIDLLKKQPGIYSSRWAGRKNDFNQAIKKVFKKMKEEKKDWTDNRKARFVCSLTIFWPNKKYVTVTGTVKGKISKEKKGNKGFGYDPIFIPDGYTKTFGELDPSIKMSIDHRYKAFLKIKNLF